MELKARFKDVLFDPFKKVYRLVFETTPADISPIILQETLTKFADQDMNLKAVRYKKKRSLDANSFYWALLYKLAEKERVSSRWLHNDLLRECAVPQLFDGKVVYTFLPDTDEAAHTADESMTYHIKPTSQIRAGKNGNPDFRAYQLLKGSSEFDSAEMARLIDCLVQRCKDSGIETMTPEEINRMVTAWRPK